MKASPARDLARRYAAGELSFEEYRSRRRDLIDSICTGTQALQYGQHTAYPLHRRKPWWVALASLTVIVVIGIAITRWAVSNHPASTAPAAAQAAKPTGANLLQTFTDANDWSEASIDQFMQQWKLLPNREQQAARTSYLFPRLISQLHEQIVSQQAMLELAPDPKAAARHLSRLQQMAALLRAQQPD